MYICVYPYKGEREVNMTGERKTEIYVSGLIDAIEADVMKIRVEFVRNKDGFSKEVIEKMETACVDLDECVSRLRG